MKKKILILPLILCMTVLTLLTPVYADAPRLVDYAGLLTDMSEEYALEQRLNEISEAYSCDIVIVTTDSLEGKTATEYADDYYDLVGGYGYGDDFTGILFLISMGEREWAFSTCGGAIPIFDDYRLMQMEDGIIPYLSDGDYYEAFSAYADMCETYLESGASDGYYDDYGGYDPYYDEYYDEYYYDYYTGTANRSSESYNLGIAALGSVAVSFVIALIVVTFMKGELNTVHKQLGAANYIRKNSFHLTSKRDIFLYRKVSKVAIDTDSHSRSGHGGGSFGGSSVHTSSSGSSHGGRSGRF